MTTCSGEFDDNADGNTSHCTPTRGCGLANCPDLQARQQRQNQRLGEAIAETYKTLKPDLFPTLDSEPLPCLWCGGVTSPRRGECASCAALSWEAIRNVGLEGIAARLETSGQARTKDAVDAGRWRVIAPLIAKVGAALDSPQIVSLRRMLETWGEDSRAALTALEELLAATQRLTPPKIEKVDKA